MVRALRGVQPGRGWALRGRSSRIAPPMSRAADLYLDGMLWVETRPGSSLELLGGLSVMEKWLVLCMKRWRPASGGVHASPARASAHF